MHRPTAVTALLFYVGCAISSPSGDAHDSDQPLADPGKPGPPAPGDAAKVTCTLSASTSSDEVGSTFTVTLNVSAPAASADWYGSKNGATEGPVPLGEWTAGSTSKSITYTATPGSEGAYTRYVRFLDSSRQPSCTTNTVSIAIVPAKGGPAPKGCPGITDNTSHAPPTTGAYAYTTFEPNQPGFVALGASYVDPVFGCSVRRLSNVFPGWGNSMIYSKNGFWNADGTLYMQNPNEHGEFDVVNGDTGAVVRANVDFGNGEGSFDPVDPDIYWWWPYQSSELRRYSVSAGAYTVAKTFPSMLVSLGGSVDWIDRTGQYFLVSYGGQLKIWDKTTDTIYAGSVPNTFGTGWAGISPDGKWLIIGGHNGQEFQHWSFPIDHASKTLSSTGQMFWSLCGPHSDIISTSDGKTYLAGFNCWDQPEIYRVDVSLSQSTSDIAKQKTDNVRLFGNDWKDSGHFSCVSKGALQDWCYAEISSGDDTFSGSGAWRPYEQEIVAVQMMPPYAVKRLAHHRSKSPFTNYTRQPRVNASWDGAKVAFASDYGYDGGAVGYSDIYFVDLR
jgi:hypothetical protein